MSVTIPAYAAGRIDVFALDLPPEATESFMDQAPGTDDPNAAWPLRAALGADYLDAKGIELVRIKDLAGIGLAGYLADGWGARPEDIAGAKAALDAMEGHAVLLRGQAYGGVAQTLAPRAPLTHIATLMEVSAEQPGPPLTSDSAEPETPEPEDTDDTPKGSGTPLPVIAGGLVAAAVLVLLLSLGLGG